MGTALPNAFGTAIAINGELIPLFDTDARAAYAAFATFVTLISLFVPPAVFGAPIGFAIGEIVSGPLHDTA